MLSIIIPAKNEAENLQDIFNYFSKKLVNIDYEIIVINDFSSDETLTKAQYLFQSDNKFKIFDNKKEGLGGAINLGIEKSSGDKVAIMMADLSDHIEDLIEYNNIMDKKKVDAVLGSRFIQGSKVKDYPLRKLILNPHERKRQSRAS